MAISNGRLVGAMKNSSLWKICTRNGLLIMLCIMFVGYGCGAPAPRLSAIPENGVVLAFGDSLTHGTGADPAKESYPAILQQLIDREVIRAGVPGEISYQGLQRLPDELAKHEPDLLILCHGGNDLLKKLPTEETVNHLRGMIELALDQGIEVVLIGVPGLQLFADPPEFYPDLAREYNIPYDGEIIPEILYDNTLKSDMTHPNAEGYRRMAAALAELLETHGAVSDK